MTRESPDKIVTVPTVRLMAGRQKFCVVCETPLDPDGHIRLCPTHIDYIVRGIK